MGSVSVFVKIYFLSINIFLSVSQTPFFRSILPEAISRHSLIEKDIEMLGCRKVKCADEAQAELEKWRIRIC